jgi:hypothetical protein
MKRSYFEILDIRTGNDYKTGLSATFDSEIKALQSFNFLKSFEVEKNQAKFMIDFYDKNGDLNDTILIDLKGFRSITDRDIKSTQHYKHCDKKYWIKQKAIYQKEKEF